MGGGVSKEMFINVELERIRLTEKIRKLEDVQSEADEVLAVERAKVDQLKVVAKQTLAEYERLKSEAEESASKLDDLTALSAELARKVAEERVKGSQRIIKYATSILDPSKAIERSLGDDPDMTPEDRQLDGEIMQTIHNLVKDAAKEVMKPAISPNSSAFDNKALPHTPRTSSIGAWQIKLKS
jgi:hypothetical protein